MNPIYHSTTWLLESQLAAYVDAFTHHFAEGRYAPATVDTYLGCLAHFAHWSTQSGIDIHDIDEKVVQQFLDEHLPHCNCAKQVHRVRRDLHAALGHLLIVLRANSVIAEPFILKNAVNHPQQLNLRAIACSVVDQFRQEHA